jgi:hypothetical protein
MRRTGHREQDLLPFVTYRVAGRGAGEMLTNGTLLADYQLEARQRSQIPPKFPLWGASAPMGKGQMWKQAGVGERVLVVLVGCAAVLLTITAAAAEPKAIVVLSSLHNLDYAEAACSRLHSIADIKDITEVLNNASDYDPEDILETVSTSRRAMGSEVCEKTGATRHRESGFAPSRSSRPTPTSWSPIFTTACL